MITAPIFMTDKQGDEIQITDICKYIKQHVSRELPRLKRLDRMYDGDQAILRRVKKDDGLSNNKLLTNHAAYIADFTSGYLLGNPVAYNAEKEPECSVIDALKAAESSVQDIDLALDAAVFGRAYELDYIGEDDNGNAAIKLARLSPLSAFVVYDDTVEQRPVFGVYYFSVFDENGELKKYKCSAYTDKLVYSFELSTGFTPISREVGVQPHCFGTVPLFEIYNNGRRKSDFEQVDSLMDAYNLLQSDRVNDKEQFVDAFLVLKGSTFGDDNDEKIKNFNALKEQRVLELPAEGADASYLIRQFDENSIEVLKNAIATDIHKITGVPDMSDENFAANASGVAIKYKLLGLEQITKTKERYFAEGIKYRLRLFAAALAVMGKPKADISAVTVTFSRSLPVNELERAQIVQMLSGYVPTVLLYSLLPFIDDPEKAAELMRTEKEESLKAQQAAFANTPYSEDADNGDTE